MPFYADLHVHSKFARATSSDLNLEHMALWAAKKGVAVLGTGDFTHPGWFAEITEKLVPAEPGLFRLKPELERWVVEQFPVFAQQPTRFLLEVEISTIYKKGEKTRKVHHLHYVPDLASAQRFIGRLARIGNLKADGRPILGLDSRELLEITLEAGEGAYLIPAHIWTPWFAVLGSKSGFDSIEECYGDLAPHIFALETGLSSDPPMNWRLSQLDAYRLVSNSDAHSPAKIGREACAFDCALDYWAIRDALRTGQGYGGTVEFFPEEGKYHLDGHRACGVRLEPEETRKHGGLCPTCGKELTVGVMHRVNELADRLEGAKPASTSPFRSLVPLPEMLAELHRVGAASRTVAESYESLVRKLGPELFILEHAPLDELGKAGSSLLAEGIARLREGRVIRQAGYDGEYGVIRVFSDDELTQGNAVSLLFDLPASPKADERAVPPHPHGDGETLTAPVEGLDDRAPNTPTPSLPLPQGEGWGEGETIVYQVPALMLAEAPPSLPLTFDPLAGLDPDQRAAAEATDGPLLILAGPGTGKTRTLTHRLAHLISNKGIAPEHLLAVTFTNRAANEMRERLHKLAPTVAERVWVTTFHGLGYRILREHTARLGLPADFRVASEAERRALLAELFNGSQHKAARWLKRVAQSRRGVPSVPEAPEIPDPTNVSGELELPAGHGQRGRLSCFDRRILADYRRALRDRGWVDFDDLIDLPVALLEAHADILARYREQLQHVSVDEFQDLDARQYRLVRLLVPPGGNLCVIGDPDQAIYGFRGAEPRFFQQFATDYPGARSVQLRHNYRSGRAIVQGALQAIAPSSLVHGRWLDPLKPDNNRIIIHESPTDKAEAEFVVHTIEKLIGGHGFFSLDSGRVKGSEARSDYSFSDFAVLYRSDAQADVLREALGRSGIPFQRHSHEPLMEAPELKAILQAMRTSAPDPSVRERLLGACRSPRQAALASSPEVKSEPPHVGSYEVERLLAGLEPLAARCGHDLARFESELALLSEADLWDPRADRVALLTLHASKGLEFAAVFITGCEDGLLPLRFAADDGVNLDEERRLFFVGMTRARERLFITHASKRLWRGQLRQQAVSPFVAAIEKELLERSVAELRRREKPAGEQLNLFG